MKTYYLTVFLLYVDGSQIRNQNQPVCRNCIHFKPDFTGTSINMLSKCNKFGSKDIVTNDIRNDFADNCRDSDDKCGLEGKFFEVNQYSDLKYMLNYMVQPLNLYLFIYLLAFYLSITLPKK